MDRVERHYKSLQIAVLLLHMRVVQYVQTKTILRMETHFINRKRIATWRVRGSRNPVHHYKPRPNEYRIEIKDSNGSQLCKNGRKQKCT
jgi:hypothetical protein